MAAARFWLRGQSRQSRVSFQSNQLNKMATKLKSNNGGTYWKNGKDAGKLSWLSGRRRQGRARLPQGRQKPRERPPLPEPCLTRATPSRSAALHAKATPRAGQLQLYLILDGRADERTLPSRAC